MLTTQHKASLPIRNIHSHLKYHLADNQPFVIPGVNIFAYSEVAGPVAGPSVAYSLSQVRLILHTWNCIRLIITSLPFQV